MIDYAYDRIGWYVDKLRDFNFYVSRKSEKNGVVTFYLISADDWRKSVILSCNDMSCFRLDILYVNTENSFHFTENDFELLLDKIGSERF